MLIVGSRRGFSSPLQIDVLKIGEVCRIDDSLISLGLSDWFMADDTVKLVRINR